MKEMMEGEKYFLSKKNFDANIPFRLTHCDAEGLINWTIFYEK